MAGGDGSQALVATVAARHDIAHVCIPAGTRNHFALDLGLDRDDVVGAMDAFDDGIEFALRLLLASPQFLIRSEREPATVTVGQSYRISDLELASRLSFFLCVEMVED